LPDLSGFIKYINWEQLDTLSQPLITLRESFQILSIEEQLVSSSEFKVWRGDRKTFHTNVFYLTEDLFCHSIVDDYICPGLLVGDNVLFRCRPIEETGFCQNLNRYWQDWVIMHMNYEVL
jgi:hypothetical protein